MSLLQCGYCFERHGKSPKIGRAAVTDDGEDLFVEWKDFKPRPGHQGKVEAGAQADMVRAVANGPPIPDGETFVIRDVSDAVRPFIPSTHQALFASDKTVVLRCPRCKAALKLGAAEVGPPIVYLKGWRHR